MIEKAELLWSRECPYACVGCTMPNPLRDIKTAHRGDNEQWREGMERIKSLGSRFVAIYGAEPLTRMEGLPEVIEAIYQTGMKATIITALPLSSMLKTLLATTSLDSVSVSYDAVYTDLFRKKKSESGIRMLLDNPKIKDRAVIATVTRLNVDEVPIMARLASDEGLWFLFDLYHPGAGEHSKCGNEPGNASLEPSRQQVRAMAVELLSLKRTGSLIHASEEYLDHISTNYTGKTRDTWHCGGLPTGWITVDADGSILACDDWQMRFPGGAIWDKGWTDDALASWLQESRSLCTGCAWNTHFDACGIEAGQVRPDTYVHGETR